LDLISYGPDLISCGPKKTFLAASLINFTSNKPFGAALLISFVTRKVNSATKKPFLVALKVSLEAKKPLFVAPLIRGERIAEGAALNSHGRRAVVNPESQRPEARRAVLRFIDGEMPHLQRSEVFSSRQPKA